MDVKGELCTTEISICTKWPTSYKIKLSSCKKECQAIWNTYSSYATYFCCELLCLILIRETGARCHSSFNTCANKNMYNFYCDI